MLLDKYLNKIICGDCLEVMKEIPDNSIDMILCDLPYFQVVKNSWDNSWDSFESYLFWCSNLFTHYKRILKSNTNLFLFTGRQYNRQISILLDSLFVEKRIIIWARKRNFNQTRGKSLSSGYEPISYYSKGSGIFNNIKIQVKTQRKEYVSGILKDGINLSDVWSDIPALPHNSPERVDHPTQKPLRLIERLILIGSNETNIILDSCAGSFTTAVACDNLNRNWICIEKEKEYCDIGLKRVINSPWLKTGDIQYR